MKVLIYVINRSQYSQYYGLKTVEGDVLHYAPNNWRTIGGAARWALNHGYIVKDIED